MYNRSVTVIIYFCPDVDDGSVVCAQKKETIACLELKLPVRDFYILPWKKLIPFDDREEVSDDELAERLA